MCKSILENCSKKIFYPVILLIILITVFTAIQNYNNRDPQFIKMGLAYNNAWILSDGTEEIPLQKLPQRIYFPTNHVYTIENTIPKITQNNCYLLLFPVNQWFSIRIADDWIFSNIGSNMLLTNAYMIPLTKEQSYETIRITFSSDVFEYSGRINEILIGTQMECYHYLIRKYIPLVFSLLSLLIISIIMISINTINLFLGIKDKTFYLLGAETLLFSVFIFVYYNPFGFLFQMNSFIYSLALIARLFLTVPLLMVFKKNLKSPFLLKLLDVILFAVLIWIFTLFLVSSNGLFTITVCFSVAMYVNIFIFLCLFIMLNIDLFLYFNPSLLWLFSSCDIFLFCTVVELFQLFQLPRGVHNLGLYYSSGTLIACFILLITTQCKNTLELRKQLQTQQELKNSRIELMVSQIKPHFIYNTLNSIQALIDIDPNQASDMICNFSKYLRTHIDVIGKEDLISFKEELENIKAYLEIETARYPNIHIEYNIKTDEFFLPALSIQPIVENAVKHGISDKIAGGTIVIESSKDEDFYYVIIQDDGAGFLPDSADEVQRHIGIKNITFRLCHLINADMTCESYPEKGTKVIVKISRKEKRK